MGSWYLGDVVTGEAIRQDDPVVAFVVGNRRVHGRSARSTMLRPAAGPAQRFLLESLPIHGAYDDFGRIHVDSEDAQAVRQVLTLSGCATWDAFQDRALREDDAEGVQFKSARRSLSLAPGSLS